MRKIFNITAGILVTLMLLSGAVAMSSASFLGNDPKTPDPATGHIIPLALRGFGTRYMTEQEWGSIALYWNVFHTFLGLFVATLVARLVVEAYRGFMQGWRADGS